MNLRCIALVCLLLIAAAADAQFYFRGEVKDAGGNGLALVQIRLHYSNSFYSSGSTGAFGIPSTKTKDTVSFFLHGYEEKTVVLNSNEYNTVLLKPSAAISNPKRRLLSVTKDKKEDSKGHYFTSGETYSSQVENSFNETADYSSVGFAMNVDKASYSNIRRFINMNSRVPPEAVRIEEMLNYFPQSYKEPAPGKDFHIQSQLTDCPWNPSNRLLFLQLQAKKINYDSLPPSNFVFLIDVSGSMDLPNRLPLLKTAFRMMVQNLRSIDTLSIMLYGGTVGIVLQPTGGNEKDKIMSVIDSLAAGGDTPGESAIRQAYRLAQSKFIQGGNNRVILATDGDFNVGESSEEALMQLITQKQQTGIYLTCLGVGMGNYKDSKLEALAKKGNGNFAYLDNVMEAEKVLVKELMQTLYVVVDDAYLNSIFQPSQVKRYRLIGFDNRKDVLADSASILEGGEIGTGHTVTAVFEIELTKDHNSEQPLAEAELRYQSVETKTRVEEKIQLPFNYQSLYRVDSSYRFAAAVTMFGLMLKQSPYIEKPNWDALINLLTTCVNPQDYWQNEMLMLVRKAKELYKPTKEKKRWFRKKEKKRDDIFLF
jgi:Ca-activated chloride channel family protein